jgi:hypothetical protein
MTTPTIQTSRYPNSKYAEGMQDFLLVSSFGLWALVLGFTPVFAFRALLGS